ncbi:MAG: AlpA family transcriptional regulator [Pseudomonadota bacterium]
MNPASATQVPEPSPTGAFAPVPQPARLLRLPEVMARVGLKRSAIYQRMSEGRFPKSRSLGPKCAVWIEAEIDAWIAKIASDD